MTVQAQDSVQYYDGPINVGAVIPITDFTFIDNSHVSLKIRGIDEIWEYGTDYTIEGADTLTRTITLNRAVEAGQVLAAYLDVPITQSINPEEGGNFPASTNEFVLDKLTYICQMLYERITRSLQVSVDTPFNGTLPSPDGKANKIIALNSTGTGLTYSTYDVAELEYIAKRLYASITNVDITANNIEDVITTAANILSVNTVAEAIQNVVTTAESIANVNIVGNDLALGADSAINKVNANKENINIAAENIDFIIEARENAQTAADKAREARLSAINAETYQNNAEIWADGSDAQVETIGGVHSARGWAEQAAKGQVQADFNEIDTESKAYIKNKPNLTNGYFPEVHVGLADNLYDESAPISIGTFTLRTTAGAESIITGPAKFNTIGGNITSTGHIDERSDINATDGITINSFDVNTFKLNNPETGTYNFIFANNTWTLNNQAVNIANYGINATTRPSILTYTTSNEALTISCDPAIFDTKVASQSGSYSFNYIIDEESTTAAWYINDTIANLNAYGIELTNTEYELQNGDNITIDFTAALTSGTVTVDYVKGVRGHLTAATPSAFVATGMQQYNGLYIDNATINDDGEIVTLAGSKVLYCLAVGGIYSGYVAYSEAGSITKIGYTAEVPQLGSILDIDGEQDANLSAIIFEENGYVCVAVTDDSDICIHPRWSSGQGQDTSYEEYNETRITIPTTSDDGEELPTATYGMPGFGGVLDEIHFQTKTYIKRVGYYPYSVENLATVQAYGTTYDYDDESIFYVLKSNDITEYSIANSLVDTYTANDYGIEYFEGTEVPLHTNISYGTNLKDKLRTDVVTISAQELDAAQQRQIQDNINILGRNGAYDISLGLTGNITLDGNFGSYSPSIDVNNYPETNAYIGRVIGDKNHVRMGNFEVNLTPDGKVGCGISAMRIVNGTNKYASIWCYIDTNGKTTYTPVQLITTYVSGTSGYNIWSNGYCEQWGYTKVKGNTETAVTLSKTFSNTNYNVNGTNNTYYNNSRYSCAPCIKKTAANKLTIGNIEDTDVTYSWFVCGYLAAGQY